VDKTQNMYWPTRSATGYELGDSYQMPSSVLEKFSNRTFGFFSIWKRTKPCSFVFKDNVYEDSIPHDDEHVYVRTHYDYTRQVTQKYQWPDTYAFTPNSFLACGLHLEHVFALRLPLPSEVEKNDTAVSLWEVNHKREQISTTVTGNVLHTFNNGQVFALLSVCVLFTCFVRKLWKKNSGVLSSSEKNDLLDSEEEFGKDLLEQGSIQHYSK